MKMIEYIEIIRKRLALIIIIPVVAAIIMAAVSCFFLDKQYEARTSLYAMKNNATEQSTTLQDIYSEEIIVRDYRGIVKSRAVLEQVKEALREEGKKSESLQKVLDLSYDKFEKRVSFKIQNNTRVMEISFKDSNPEVCATVANKIASVFMDKAKKITRMDNLQILDPAVVPELPIWPKKLLSVFVAFFGGLMVSVFAAFLLEYLESGESNAYNWRFENKCFTDK